MVATGQRQGCGCKKSVSMYFFAFRWKQNMVPDNSENWGNQIFYRLELHISGLSDLKNIMQNRTPYWVTVDEVSNL